MYSIVFRQGSTVTQAPKILKIASISRLFQDQVV